MSQTNFLIGRGELLTHDIKGPKRKPNKAEVYTLEHAKERLVPQFIKAAKALDKLPNNACPDDFGVVRLAINPSYIAKSFFPAALLRFAGLESVGSRTVKIIPEAWSKKGPPRECSTTELFVAGKRESFRNLQKWVGELEPDTKEALDLAHIEKFSVFAPEERIVSLGDKSEHFFEVGIHLISDENNRFVQQSFISYAKKIELKTFDELSFIAGNLWFIPVEGKHKSIHELAKFSLVRVIRSMPKLRALRPMQRTGNISISCTLPTEQPLSSEPKVAILDGGLPEIILSVLG